MNTINPNTFSAPTSGLPDATPQTTNSPQDLDALGEEFTNMMNSTAPAPAAGAALGSTPQSKVVQFQEHSNILLDPNIDPATKKSILSDLQSEFQEILKDPGINQLMAENPDRAADLNRAAERIFQTQIGDPVAVMEFKVALNAVVYGEPKLHDDPQLLGELREALDNLHNNPQDPVALINLQMVMARLTGAPQIPDNPEIAQKINAALDRVRANPGDASALENLKRVMDEVTAKGAGAPATTA